MAFEILKYSFKSNLLLGSIEPDYMLKLEGIKSVELFTKNDVLYEQGSEPKAVYHLRKGKVKIEQLGQDGKTRIVYVYIHGDFFGFRPLLSNEKHPVTAIFLEDSEIEIYEGNEFIKIAKESSNLSFNLVEILSFEFNVWINLISSLSHKSAKEKIALILLILNEKYRNEDGISEIIMTKSDISKYSETSKETVVRVIGYLEKQGVLINKGRTFEIINHKILEIIAEGF
ncbi:Crp/Fnr family transcriptional regulator [Flavobacterium sp. HJJ]|uniref:Crp/Fnr family transcriptional regulator n=1 Tax=Flavobacterium sp. HJJ TaxID=2783792 RepID=UPI00188CC6E6|nr:Crp/Fnr family transcriptional regulator [Flavobacterium sp. HJJ]MBF4471566.1 Crp/Fnr family transcriptional regulator [Flavobacterium sp. HJJ]